MAEIYSNYLNIDETRKLMLNKISELYKDLLVIESKIDETKKDFDTPAANKIRLKANELINNQKRVIDKELIPFVNKLETVSREYESAYNDIKSSVEGEQ